MLYQLILTTLGPDTSTESHGRAPHDYTNTDFTQEPAPAHRQSVHAVSGGVGVVGVDVGDAAHPDHDALQHEHGAGAGRDLQLKCRSVGGCDRL